MTGQKKLYNKLTGFGLLLLIVIPVLVAAHIEPLVG